MKKIFFLLAAITISTNVFSQNFGTLKGIVYDSAAKKSLPNANITIEGSSVSSMSNEKGEFTISVAAGVYKVVISNIGFEERTFDSVVIFVNKTNNLGVINLKTKPVQVSQGIGIKTKRPKTNTEKAVLDEIKKSEVVVSGVSSEQFAKTNDNDAAKAAARVPGVTLMENRFIMLRGLSQRYNSVQINNINAPSTEIDRRTFSFDLIPSSMLDKIMIYKSGAGDLAGDFAGGVIKLSTKTNTEKDFLNFSFSGGYRVGTSFQKHQNNKIDNSVDILGFDNGYRAMPGSIPSSLNAISTPAAVEYSKLFNNNFGLTETMAPIDFGYGISFGKNVKFGKVSLFTINNIGHSSNYQYATMNRYRYQNEVNSPEGVAKMFSFRDQNFAIENKINVMSNWIFTLNKKNKISFKNLFNQIGENETTVREGIRHTERPNDEFKNYSFHYTSRSIYNGQIEGNHQLKEKSSKLNYTIGFGNVKRNEPDFRRFRTFRAIGSGDAYQLVDPPQATTFDAARFYSTLNENTYSVSLNFERELNNFLDTTKKIGFKGGIYSESKDREFSARWLSYVYTGNTARKAEILTQPISEIFSEKNMNQTAGFRISEGTNPSDRYSAKNQLLAAYTSFNIPFDAFVAIIGLRYENFYQELNSFGTGGQEININLPSENFLPSLNLTYMFNKKSQLRGAYYKTINRPEFRELAPFVYYDFMYDLNIVGNPNLKVCTIDNFDLRYEFYPGAAETITVGGFYKKFINPIENYVTPVGLDPQFDLRNALSAVNYGAELEIRKSMDNVFKNELLKKLSLVGNFSYIYSQVDLGADASLTQDRKRQLQGQSPFIVNSTLAYIDLDKNLNINLTYNVFGKRIAFVGNNLFPTIYEMPRHVLDLNFSKKINNRISVKAGISDILNYQNQLWQDTNGDGKIKMNESSSVIKKSDHQLLNYRRGQMISFGATFKIY